MTPHKKGRIAVFGDSNCLDSSHMVCPRSLTPSCSYSAQPPESPFISATQSTNCYLLLRQLLEYTSAVRHDAARCCMILGAAPPPAFADERLLGNQGREEPQLFTAYAHRREPLGSPSERLPERRTDINFKDVSTVWEISHRAPGSHMFRIPAESWWIGGHPGSRIFHLCTLSCPSSLIPKALAMYHPND